MCYFFWCVILILVFFCGICNLKVLMYVYVMLGMLFYVFLLIYFFFYIWRLFKFKEVLLCYLMFYFFLILGIVINCKVSYNLNNRLENNIDVINIVI